MDKKPSKEVLAAIRKAARTLKKASDECADVDALVATYWKDDGGSTPVWWQSKDIRSLSDTLYTMMISFQARANAAKKEQSK